MNFFLGILKMSTTKSSKVILDDIDELAETLEEDIPFHTFGCPDDCPLCISAERLRQFRDLIIRKNDE